MSFARDLKLELARLEVQRECCRKAELYAISLLTTSIEARGEQGYELNYSCDSPAMARRIYVMLKELYGLNPRTGKQERKRFNQTRIYVVDCGVLQSDHPLINDMGLGDMNAFRRFSASLVQRNCCRRSFLRGVFSSRGYINKPEADYHLELILPDTGLSVQVQKMVQRFGIDMRCIERKNSLVLYLKDGERIGDFLRLIGASKAVLDFENARIVKYIRNTVNRQVNCETANVNKTIEAAVRQSSLIERLVARVDLEKLPDDLQELAMLRIEYPDENLRELGMKMEPPLSKSGVAYRMRKLEKYASVVLNE